MNTLWERVWARGQGTSLSVEDAGAATVIPARMRMLLLLIAGRCAGATRPPQVAYVAVVHDGSVPLGVAALWPGSDKVMAWPRGLFEGGGDGDARRDSHKG